MNGVHGHGLFAKRMNECPDLRASAPLRLELGRVLRDRYVLEQRLGGDGSGAVFKALDRYRDGLPAPLRYVAIRVFHGHPSAPQQSLEALRQELQSAQMLSHENIVKVYDFDKDGDIDFLTMEFLEGEPLSQLMQRFQPVPMARPHAWSIIQQIASGLEHAHVRNIVHADLKPQNIMITNSGEVRILDFGAARHFAAQSQIELDTRGASSAASAYACCELLDGRSPDPRDDLYALSCIAYELLTGSHPFQRRRANQARDFGVVATRPSGLSRRQWHTLAKGLSWHRAGRSIAVREWLKRLGTAAEPASRVAIIRDMEPARLRGAPIFRAPAIVGLLLAIATIWILFARMAPGVNVRGETLSSAAASDESLNQIHSVQDAASLPADAALSAASVIQSHRRGSTIMPGDYQVEPGQHFAEIRVHRSAKARDDSPVVWWTEAASAKPGVDYVGQARVAQSFPKGKDSMSFFVKLLPNATRTQGQVFYIAIADKGDKRASQSTHTAVHLPSNRTAS